jgi:hypothetical protein
MPRSKCSRGRKWSGGQSQHGQCRTQDGGAHGLGGEGGGDTLGRRGRGGDSCGGVSTSGLRSAPSVHPVAEQRFSPRSGFWHCLHTHMQCCGSRPQARRGHIFTHFHCLRVNGPHVAEVGERPSRDTSAAGRRIMALAATEAAGLLVFEIALGGIVVCPVACRRSAPLEPPLT